MLRPRDVTSVWDLAMWGNYSSTLRRIERIIEVTQCAQEPAGIATKWYLGYQSHRATGLGPRARAERLEELMEADQSRATCMLAWHQKWRALAERLA